MLKNHFHIVLRIKDKELLEEKIGQKPHLPFSNLFNAYSKSINKAYNRTGSLFQEHFHRKRVENEEYLLQLIAYIHLNPIKHSFSDNFKTYPYSSYKAYVSNTSSFVSTDFVMSLFGDRENFEFWHNLKRLYLEDKIEDI